MSTLTYSEARQRTYFKAARAMRAIAAGVLDDMSNDVECRNPAIISWAVNVAKTTALKARELEELGHEECVSEPRQDTENAKSRDRYGAAIDAFERRVRDAGATTWLPGAGDRIHPANSREKVYAR